MLAALAALLVAAPAPADAEVEAGERLVVALGDSVASGEGNPEAKRPRWLDRPCHRSAAAGFQQAAELLGQGLAGDRRGRSVSFVSLACSGATIETGLLGPYAGIEPDRSRQPYEPQVDRLAALAAARGEPRPGRPAVDAVLLSVGANDIGFSRIVKRCALSVRHCAGRLEDRLSADLASLPDRYDRLGRHLRRAAPGAPVLVGEYFDPVRDERGRFCGRSLGLISRSEAQWAYEAVLRPLNDEIEAAAQRWGWRFVDGIAADFSHHGYCAKRGERWVRVLSSSLRRQGDHRGTLHPSRRGHTAIARRFAPPLADALGLAAPEAAPSEENGEEGRGALEWVGIGAAALVALLIGLPLLLLAAIRVVLIWRPTWPRDPNPEEAEQPRLPGAGLGARDLLVAGLAAVALFALAVLLSGLAGRSILWLRFWSANLPADQAVDAVAASELVATGWQALWLFALLGLVAAGVAWLLDGKGRWVRETRRGLVAIGAAEMVAAIWIGDFGAEQRLQLIAGLAVAALLLHFLVEAALGYRAELAERRRPGEPVAKAALAQLWGWARRRLGGLSLRGAARLAWRAAPLVPLAVAVVASLSAEGVDRRLWVWLPIGVAALLLVAPGGMASRGVALRNPDTASLRAPRIALALAILACVTILVARDEAWLAASAVVAVALGAFCLAIAAASGNRFAPYGLAVLVAVPAFGAAATALRGVDSPQLQPGAALLKSGEAICGAYVGESDGTLWMARVRLDERHDVRRPRDGEIFSVPAERVAATAVAPLRPVAGVERRAAALRDALLAEGEGGGAAGPPDCGSAVRPGEAAPAATPATPQERRRAREARLLRRLAERYQPELVIDRRDGFWPIPVRTLFSMRDRRAAACRQPAVAAAPCLRLTGPEDLPWTGGRGEHIEYPAADDDRDEQHELMVRALGSADPDRSALVYYLASRGGPGDGGSIAIQYWFFYPFNYQPTRLGSRGGFHEGDFEAVAILLSAKTQRPRYVWMNRHGRAEGRLFPWDDEALVKRGDHLQVHPARGSHASYESCARQRRPAAPLGLIDDYPACDAGRPLRLPPETTRLADLTRTGWACWEGLFGHAGGGLYKRLHLIGDAPRSPLWQQDFGGARTEPCRGIADPGGRDGRGEEVLSEFGPVPAMLRRRAGNLLALVDRCADWEAPAATGTYMVACDQTALDDHLANGLERSGPPGVRIDMARPGAPRVGEYALPAIRRNPAGSYLDGWRIVAASPTEVSVFTTCPRSGRDEAIGARFKRVRVAPGAPLRLRDRGGGGTWRLTDPRGRTVAAALPFRTRVAGGALVAGEPQRNPKRPLACGPR